MSPLPYILIGLLTGWVTLGIAWLWDWEVRWERQLEEERSCHSSPTNNVDISGQRNQT